MTTQQVLAIVKDRGLDIVLVEGRPVLQRNGTTGTVTDALLAVLKVHRERIIDHLRKQ